MACIGIFSAMPVEIEGILKICNAKEMNTPHFYKIFGGKLGSNDVVVACGGIGKVNSAACTQHLIDCYHPDAVINMGIAGGISEKLKTLDVVIGSDVIYHDFSPLSLLDKYFPFEHAFKCDQRLIEAAKKACADCPEVKNYYVGRVASGDCFVQAGQVKDRIRNELNAVCCEMEGAPIGHVCHINEVPFLIIRTISDLADEGAKISYDEFEKKASLQSNRVVSGIIRSI